MNGDDNEGTVIAQRRSCARLDACLFNEASLNEPLNDNNQKLIWREEKNESERSTKEEFEGRAIAELCSPLFTVHPLF